MKKYKLFAGLGYMDYIYTEEFETLEDAEHEAYLLALEMFDGSQCCPTDEELYNCLIEDIGEEEFRLLSSEEFEDRINEIYRAIADSYIAYKVMEEF